jgi:hypothetical protein
MKNYVFYCVLALAVPSGAHPAIAQTEPDALSRLWHDMAAEEYPAPEHPEGYAAALAECILDVLSPIGQPDRDLLAETRMNPGDEAAARIDALVPDMGSQFAACGEKVAEQFEAAQTDTALSGTDTSDDPLAGAVETLASERFGADDPDYYTEAWQRAFSACLMEVFAPLSEEDRAYLASVGVNPDRDNAERLEAAYPGFIDDVRACADIDPADL